LTTNAEQQTHDEQRSALLDSLADGGQGPVAEQDGAAQAQQPPDGQTDTKTEPVAEQKPPVETKVEPAETPSAEPAAPTEAAHVADQKPTQPTAETPYIPMVREGAAERLQAIDAEIDAIAQKFDDGEEDPGALLKQNNALLQERAEIHGEMHAAQQFAAAAQHTEAQRWHAAQERFRQAHPDLWADEKRFEEMNAAVRFLANTSPQLTHDELLHTARRFLEIRDGAMAPAPEPDKASVREKARQAVDTAQDQPPMSLSDIPGGMATGATEFDVVANKSPSDMLDDVMSWPEDKRAAWLDRRV